MSNVEPVTKKTVKIKENALVDFNDNSVNEAVAAKKTQWLAEQAKKDANKTQLLERKILALESKFKTLLEGKR